VKRYVATVSSRFDYEYPQDYEHLIEAEIDADLARFKGTMMLPGVLDQINGHLFDRWGPGFVVEQNPQDPTTVTVHFNGELDELVRRNERKIQLPKLRAFNVELRKPVLDVEDAMRKVDILFGRGGDYVGDVYVRTEVEQGYYEEAMVRMGLEIEPAGMQMIRGIASHGASLRVIFCPGYDRFVDPVE
jgi:hypothetical protein